MSYFDTNFEETSLNPSPSYKKQVLCSKMPGKHHFTVSSDKCYHFMRGSQLSSMFSDYTVEDFIGNGAFASVARCFKSATKKMVAVKITKTYLTYEAKEEEAILRKLKAFNPDKYNFVRWESSFIYKAHLCQEFELLDISLKEFVSRRQTSSLLLKEIRPILHQVATALTVLKDLGIAHRDLKPDNIMMVDHVRQPLKIKVIDFGSACHVSKAEQGSYAQSRWYRAPETILGLPCNEAMDMWSLGCIAAELFLGFVIYPGSCEYEMIWNITQTQGQLPGHLLNAGLKTSKFYLRCWPDLWRLMKPHEYRFYPVSCILSSLDDLKRFQQPVSHLSAADVADVADLENFVELVKQLLHLVPTERITSSQVLQHPFITMHHQSLLPVSEEDQPVLTHIKRPLKRKRDDVAQNCNRRPDSSSPERKKCRICEEKSVLKRPYSQISTDSKSISETCSPERKRMTKDTDKKESAVTPSILEGASSSMIQLKTQKRKDTALSSQSDPRTSESALTETKTKEDQRVAKIWIIGSSYVKRAEWGARKKFGEDFGLNAKVQWFGKGGMRWNGVLPRFYTELSTQSPPDILVIHAGGNDLGLISAQELSSVMKKELMQLHAEFPSMTIAYSCINERRVWRYGSPQWINLDRKSVNSNMRKAADCFGGVVIEHPCLRHFDKMIFVPDGVHFTKKGNELFVTNIHSAVRKILQSSQTK